MLKVMSSRMLLILLGATALLVVALIALIPSDALRGGAMRSSGQAAATEDRFLMSIGRPQRFGTQYRADGPNAGFKLYQMEEGITDAMRTAMDVPAAK